MKLPNRYGTVTKLSGNRRRPYMVREGKTGQQRIIGYAATKEDGLQMLAEYNRNPYDLDAKKVTLSELFSLWLQNKAARLSKSSVNSMKTIYKKHCKPLHDMPYREIKTMHIYGLVNETSAPSSMSRIKGFFGHMDKYALELDIIEKSYSALISVEHMEPKERQPFTGSEVQVVYQYSSNRDLDSILFLLYTGFRASEMLELKIENIDLNAGIMRGGIKTSNGKNRIVPIHSQIKHIVEKHYRASNSGYLFEHNGFKMSYAVYRKYYWNPSMEFLKMDHTPHECRHSFRSALDSCGANKVCIDLLMGHKSLDVGERVYTHKTIDELKEAINLLQYNIEY